jgi:predicted nucleic acid-binding protein
LSDLASTVIIMTEEQLRAFMTYMSLDPYCAGGRRFLGVVDANALLSSVGNDCRKGARWRSRLLRMTGGGTATLYAPDEVYSEVYEHLPRIAASAKLPTSELRTCFAYQYLPTLRFVTVDTTQVDDPQVLAITDPDDVPLGQLAKLIAPCVVFSADKHLRKPGLAPDDWLLAAQFAIDLVDATMREQRVGQAAHGLSLPVSGAVELIKFVGRRTSIPGWALGLLVGGGVAYALWTPERRKAASKYVLPVLEAYCKEAKEAADLSQRGLAGLREVLLSAPTAPNVKQQTAIILARQREPLLAREVQAHMLNHFASELVPTVSEVRTVLSGSPEFVQPERYRWQFGRMVGPQKLSLCSLRPGVGN